MRNFTIAIIMIMVISFQSISAQEKMKCMETSSEQAKPSCKLTTPELQQRKKTVIAELKHLMLEKVEMENGFRYKFEGSDQMLDKLNEFIKTERMCCVFFEFTLTVSGDANVAWLEISGPKGVKQFIKEEMEF